MEGQTHQLFVQAQVLVDQFHMYNKCFFFLSLSLTLTGLQQYTVLCKIASSHFASTEAEFLLIIYLFIFKCSFKE